MLKRKCEYIPYDPNRKNPNKKSRGITRHQEARDMKYNNPECVKFIASKPCSQCGNYEIYAQTAACCYCLSPKAKQDREKGIIKTGVAGRSATAFELCELAQADYMYNDYGMSYQDISTLFGISYTCVRGFLVKDTHNFYWEGEGKEKYWEGKGKGNLNKRNIQDCGLSLMTLNRVSL